MDELTFEGEKYISSKRAARLSGYTKDYIGQLSRSGSLKARMVGRNWYISEPALKAHRKTYKGEPIVTEDIWEKKLQESESLEAFAQQHISKEEEEEREALIHELFDLRYAKDTTPLVPHINKLDKPYVDTVFEEQKQAFVPKKDEERKIDYVLETPSSHVLSLRSSDSRGEEAYEAFSATKGERGAVLRPHQGFIFRFASYCLGLLLLSGIVFSALNGTRVITYEQGGDTQMHQHFSFFNFQSFYQRAVGSVRSALEYLD